jgi:hypothetical protein
MATRTGVGIADGAGAAVAGKTAAGYLGLWEGQLPQRQQQAQRAATTRARNRGANP